MRSRLVVWNVLICFCVSKQSTHHGAKPWLRRCTSPRPHATRAHTARSATPCAALWRGAAHLLAAAATTCRRPTRLCACAHTPQADGGTHARVPPHVSSPRRPPDIGGPSMVPHRCAERTRAPSQFTYAAANLAALLQPYLQFYKQYYMHAASAFQYVPPV